MGNSILVLDVLKVFGLGSLSFFLGILFTPFLIKLFNKNKLWSKEPKTVAITGEEASVVRNLRQNEKKEVPRIGGILVWGSVLLVTAVLWALPHFFDLDLFSKLNYVSRNQTWLPLFALITASLIGLSDDILQINNKGSHISGGLDLKKRILMVLVIGFIAAWWFYTRLDHSYIRIPFFSPFNLGILYIPFFMLVMLGTFSGGIIDGIDGLAGGVFAAIFAAYSGIAFFQAQIDLAALLSVVVGGILAFLWFNIPPAKFYMGETGILGLTAMLTVVAFLTDAVLVLPIIAFPLVISSGSAIIQIVSKKYFGRKVFLAAPIHHHYEAMGWTREQVTMRFWVLSVVFAIIGMVITIIG